MQACLKKLPPNVLALMSNRPTKKVVLESVAPDTRMKQITRRLQKAKFSGKADTEKVPLLYRNYVEQILTD
eukprot:1883437-Prymnesium_polylepis.2